MRAVVFIVAATLVVVTSLSSATDAEEDTIDVRAASRLINCSCQCSNIQFLDKYGKLNGNCATADSTGALWCYTDVSYSQCSDLKRSRRLNQFYSYEACATPALDSPQCAGLRTAPTVPIGTSVVPPGPVAIPPAESGSNLIQDIFIDSRSSNLTTVLTSSTSGTESSASVEVKVEIVTNKPAESEEVKVNSGAGEENLENGTVLFDSESNNVTESEIVI